MVDVVFSAPARGAVVCESCGAMVPAEKTQLHEEWHQSLEAQRQERPLASVKQGISALSHRAT